ncbi:hypothetical protein C4J95_1418 [Pseudomonas orientalis]|nr:hypothetical protein C4J96_1409 [Pseudomonas orientalis]AZE98895.1 hypothetical protein C4J95_1418 [Pseudomonas orientalis]
MIVAFELLSATAAWERCVELTVAPLMVSVEPFLACIS